MRHRFATAFICLAASYLPAPALAQTQGDALVNPGPHPKLQTEDITREELLDRLFGQLRKAQDEKSAKVVEKAIWQVWARSGSVTADTMLTQASKAMQADQYRAALVILDTLIDIYPDFSEAWNRRATLYFMMRDFDASRRDIARVLDLEPRHFGALSGLGMIERELGHKRAALDAYRRALAIDPYLPAAKKAADTLQEELEQDI